MCTDSHLITSVCYRLGYVAWFTEELALGKLGFEFFLGFVTATTYTERFSRRVNVVHLKFFDRAATTALTAKLF